MGRLLDAYDRLQAQPFGTFSARNSDPGLRQMNSQRSALTSALRTGIKKARERGDAEGVIKNINAANAYGVEATGVGSYEARQAGSETYADQITKQADINARLANQAAAGVDKVSGMPQETGTQRIAPGQPVGDEKYMSQDPDQGAGSQFVSRISSSPVSFADQEKAKREQLNASGAFGSGARDAQIVRNRGAASSLVDSVMDYTIGGNLDEVTATPSVNEDRVNAALPRAVALGGTKDSFLAAVERRRQKKLRA